jgi:hypothetical protein
MSSGHLVHLKLNDSMLIIQVLRVKVVLDKKGSDKDRQ